MKERTLQSQQNPNLSDAANSNVVALLLQSVALRSHVIRRVDTKHQSSVNAT